MDTILIILCVIMSIFLILAVLVQPGKADMISGMGGFGGQMNNLFGVRQSKNILQQITIGLAAGIVVLSVVVNKAFLPEVEDGSAGRAPVTKGAAIPAQTAPAPQRVPAQPQQPQPATAPQGN